MTDRLPSWPRSKLKSVKYKIIITDFICDDLLIEKSVLGEDADIIALNASHESELCNAVEDADALIVYHTLSVSKNTIDALRQCKLIVRAGVGIDNVDHLYARSRGIPVANIPDYGSEDVADTAVGMMLALTRGVHYLNTRLRSGLGEWSYTQVQPLGRLRNRNIGIIGLGRIGTAMAIRAKALGMNVIFYDPFKPDGYDKALGIHRADELTGLLEQVQVVSLHCPLTTATHHLINEKTLSYLPAGSYIVNTARGALVDTSAIPAAIISGKLAGAAFDVLEQEPPVTDPLIQAWMDPQHPAHHKVIINPHAAFYTEEGLKEIRSRGAIACMRALKGLEIRNVVN
jgi:C-terminal binding protein